MPVSTTPVAIVPLFKVYNPPPLNAPEISVPPAKSNVTAAPTALHTKVPAASEPLVAVTDNNELLVTDTPIQTIE